MNKDPYEVLGIPRNADDETVKKAYRELARKFHPDNYASNPDFAALAEEKMKEINEAYDEITKQRASGNSHTGSTYTSYSSTSSDTSSHSYEYSTVRQYINSGNISGAYDILNRIPVSERNAEWHFLYGCVCMKKGWNLEAYNHIRTACNMDPGNMEYQSVLNNLTYTTQQNSRGYSTGDPNASGCCGCDTCSGLLCADCCCELMGGDLIPCC